MANKKTTRRALWMSVISLILCCAMLTGTTFAWFTDNVTSGMNQINAGNLDIELYAGETKVDTSTKLFTDVTLWEPGAVVYENLQVKNVGTLALKYQMSLTFGNENTLNGHKLSEVLKVAILDEKIDKNTITRAEVLTKAKAAWGQGLGSLSNFYETGALNAGETGPDQTIVIFWDPNDNATDNLYNANNGQVTSDGQSLRIELGVKLDATQQMNESDSFGSDYDKFSSILPKATVNNTGAKTVTARSFDNIGTAGTATDLDVSFQFLPNETKDEGAASSYRYWHADYVVSADKDVAAGTVALAGYYDAYCSMINDEWVVLTGSAVEAGEEIRLLEAMGASVNYEEICNYGNDNIGFQCGIADLSDGANAGTTITVELRLYETTKDPNATSGTANEETGNYEVVGKYTYTFPVEKTKISTAEELANALNSDVADIQLAAGEYKMPSSDTTGDITISGTKDAVLDVTKGAYMDDANVTIKGVTIKTSTGYVMDDAGNKGSDYAALYTPNVTYINCTFEGPMRVGRDGAKFINCTFNSLGNDYVWTYGNDVTFEGCTFNTDGKAILIYSDGGNEVSKVSVKNCVFNATASATASAIANQNCAAIEIHNYGNGVNLTTSGNTYDSKFSGEWRIKTYETGKPGITVNGTEYTTIALDGKTMTKDANNNVTVNE